MSVCSYLVLVVLGFISLGNWVVSMPIRTKKHPKFFLLREFLRMKNIGVYSSLSSTLASVLVSLIGIHICICAYLELGNGK
jgi:hypothetical protein